MGQQVLNLEKSTTNQINFAKNQRLPRLFVVAVLSICCCFSTCCCLSICCCLSTCRLSICSPLCVSASVEVDDNKGGMLTGRLSWRLSGLFDEHTL